MCECRSRDSVGVHLCRLPGVRRRFVMFFVIGDDQVGDLEDQIACSAVSDGKLMPGAETVEHRHARTMEGNAQSLRGLTTVRMGHQEIAAARQSEALEILEITDHDLVRRYTRQNRGLGCRHGDCDMGAHLMEKTAEIIE